MALDTFEIEARLLLEAVYLRYQYDFRRYAKASLLRRLGQALERLEYPTLSALQEQVLRDPKVFRRLLPFLTVQVSEMFRDPSYYRSLREKVLPMLATYPSIKVWVAGASTGEEVYSLAILLREADLLDRTILYATDINPDALRQAQAGIYEAERVSGFSRNYRESGGKGSLSDYYTAAYDAVVFDKGLRRNVVFSDHSLATDEVFAEVHLVSCRNVLIYFDRDLQERAFRLFRDALSHKGYLGLGSKETLRFSRYSDDFEEVVPADRIYRKK